MVVVDNLLYILDTEVRSCFVKQFELFEQSEFEFEIYPCVSGCSESLGSALSCHDSLLARTRRSRLSAHCRMWLCLHGGVRITVLQHTVTVNMYCLLKQF